MASINRSMSGLKNREKTSVAKVMGAEMEERECGTGLWRLLIARL